MAEEKRDQLSSTKQKKASAYDEPFNNQKTVSYASQTEKPAAAPKATSTSTASGNGAGAAKTMKNASDAPKKEPPRRAEASTAEKKTINRKSDKKTGKMGNEINMDMPRSSRPAHRVIPYLLYALSAFVGLALVLNLFCNPGNVLTNPSDHWMGVVGYWICYGLNGLFGLSALALPLLLINLGMFWKRFIDHKITISKIIASALFLVTLSATVHTFALTALSATERVIASDELLRLGAAGMGGGLIGGGVGYFLYSICSFVGALIIEFLLLALTVFYFLGMTPQYVWNHLSNRRKLRAKRAPSYSEQSAEDAENRAKMERKIRRTTTGQTDIDDLEDFEADAPVGAVRVVSGTQKKSPADKMAPMPTPRLDPNDGEKVFVPEAINQKMAEAEKEEALANEMAVRQAAQAEAVQRAEAAQRAEATQRVEAAQKAETVRNAEAQYATPKPIEAFANRDAAVEPIFPKTAESRMSRKVPRAERNFDLGSIFVDPERPRPAAQPAQRHVPVPPEVPLAGTRTAASATASASAQSRPAATPAGARTTASAAAPASAQVRPAATATGAKPATAPTGARPAASSTTTPSTAAQPARPQQTVNGSIRTPNTARPASPTPTARPTQQPAAQKPIPAPAQMKPQNREFGLSSEEFEKREAQQITLPRAGEAKKPATAATKPAQVAEAKPAAQSVQKKAEQPAEPKHYIFPPIAYLHPAEPISEENKAEIQANMHSLTEMLKSFHVSILPEYSRYACGPTVTRYEITPAPGVRVRSIINLADDIALALRAPGKIRIEAPIPGTNSIGIEVPNRSRSTIFLRELIESEPFTKSKNKLTACLGAGTAGEPLVFEINKMPHLLVAGTTNSGKSVCINSIIMSLIYRLTPDEVKFVMIDPKKVEFAVYQNIPHLMAPVVTSPADAAGALQASVEEMEHRYELFASVGVRDIKGYTEATANDPDMPHLPFIIIIIDELADLMMTARDEVETAICRIAQKARAAGMHLIIGTQRPSADVVTGLIKSNVPSRIAFTVKSQIDSRVILDGIGAEALTGMGDMLFVPVGAMRNERVQGAFVSDKEVEKICEFIRATNGSAHYDENFISKLKELAVQCGNKGKGGASADSSLSLEDGDKGADPKYADAVRIAIEEKRVSTSLLQRKLEIGYSRAAKLIDRMQAEGYVSPPDGSKPRTILITPEQYMEKFVDNPEGTEE